MAVNHRKLRVIVALAIGLLLSWYSYRWVSDPERPARRATEESVVLASRDILQHFVGNNNVEISDSLARVKAAGKAYIFPAGDGWELSGHYRRSGEKVWHDYLMALDDQLELVSLSVNDIDPDIVALARTDPKLIVSQ